MGLKDEYDTQNSRIEALVEDLRRHCQTLGRWQPTAAAQGRAPATVSEALAALDAARQALAAPGATGTQSPLLASKVLDHLIAGVKAAWTEFAARKRAVEPLIEQNRYVLETLIRSYQESYRFWQEIREQVVTNYDPSGKQRTSGRGSGFAVRA